MGPQISPRHGSVLMALSHLPRKMVSIHGQENASEFVLHDLCAANCFGLQKAAYFIDNPDFNCLKGVAGYNHENRYPGEDIYWNECDNFSCHMQDCSFNQNVRTMIRPSHKKNGIASEKIVDEIAKQLEFNNPSFYTWGLKHDNSGLFIYETHAETPELDEHMKNGLHLLSFCPIF